MLEIHLSSPNQCGKQAWLAALGSRVNMELNRELRPLAQRCLGPRSPASSSTNLPMPSRSILSVGQCAFDHNSIARHLQQSFGAQVTAAATATEALEQLRTNRFDLILVNRISVGDRAPGIDLIRILKTDPQLAALPVMLVSNYPDAQKKAIALGALPGFGKAQIREPETQERLARVLTSP